MIPCEYTMDNNNSVSRGECYDECYVMNVMIFNCISCLFNLPFHFSY